MDIHMQSIITQLHLYKNPVEAFIKTIIMYIAYSGGILVLAGNDDQNTIGGAYLIFSLSLLMEFVPKLMDEKSIQARIVHIILCLIIAIAFIISISIMFGVLVPDFMCRIMSASIAVVMVYMLIDAVLVYVIPMDAIENQKEENNTFENSEKTVKVREFETRLNGGSLGNLQEERSDV